LADIMTDINTTYPGTVYNVLYQLRGLYGEVQLSNAGVVRTEMGDCDACRGIWCYLFDFSLDDGGWVARGGAETWSGGAWRTSNNILSIKREFDVSTLLSVQVIAFAATPGGLPFRGIYFDDAATIPPDAGNEIGDGTGPINFTLTYDVTTGYIGMNIDSGDIPSGNYITAVKVRGTGENPFGESNC